MYLLPTYYFKYVQQIKDQNVVTFPFITEVPNY